MFKRILFPVDFTSTSELVLHSGLAFAKACQADVHVLHVLTRHSHQAYFAAEGVGVVYHKTQEKAKLDRLIATFDPEAKVDLVFGDSAAGEILKYSDVHGCDLIVMGSRGRSAVGEMILGSTTEQVIHDSKVPMMMIRQPAYGKTLELQLDRILVPIDFSPSSLRALALGKNLASLLGSHLHLVHVVDPHTLHELQSDHPELEWDSVSRPQIIKTVNQVLRGLFSRDVPMEDLTLATLFGNVIHEIVDYTAMEECGFIIMGSHGRTPLERLFLGSVSRGVLGRVHVPVLILPRNVASED